MKNKENSNLKKDKDLKKPRNKDYSMKKLQDKLNSPDKRPKKTTDKESNKRDYNVKLSKGLKKK